MTSTPSRRQVLCGLLIGLAAPGALAACAGGQERTGGVGDAKPGDALAKASAVPVGGGTLVNAGNTGLLLLTQPSAGTFHAFNPTCTHLGETVDPPENNVITCPAHGSQFNPANGAVEHGPATLPLASVAIRIQSGSIVLA